MTSDIDFTATGAVPQSQAFDQDALANWLQCNVDGYHGALQVLAFKGGQSNPTYKLITPERTYVMRCKPGSAAKLLPSAHAIEREFAVMSGLADSAVPVPEMLGLCENEAVLGRAFYIMSFVPGRIFWDQSLPGMTPAQRSEIYVEMNRVIAALHQVDFAAVGLADYGRVGNYFERQINR